MQSLKSIQKPKKVSRNLGQAGANVMTDAGQADFA